MDRLIFLGNGDSMGVPRAYCECAVCEEARQGGLNRRWRSSAAVRSGDDLLMIDGGPDWKSQMELLGLRRLRTMLVTHAHHDHIGGLPEWADTCRWLSEKGDLHAPEEVLQTINERFPWLTRNLNVHGNDAGCAWQVWRIRPWKVNHGKNGHAYAYLWEKPGFRWVYCSDAIGLTEEQTLPLHGLDLLVLGTNFYREHSEYNSRSVYDMVEAIDLIREVRPGKVLFTHLSHDIDVRRSYPLPDHVALAHAGLEVELGG